MTSGMLVGMLCPGCSAAVDAGDRFCGACGRTLDLSSAPTQTGPAPPTPANPTASTEARFLPGATVGERYRIVGLVGRGGMGEVYRADDLKLGQPVALKVLPRELPDYEDRLTRFLNEVKIARQVSHPNVCRVYDVGESEGHHYLSMEYVDGEDLATLLRRIGRLPEDKAVQIARQLCAGLAAAHELGVLHRDLKPANVLLDGRGQAKLTDFGLAGMAAGLAGEEVRAGTPAYLSPEQIAGREVSVRSDLYSLGLVLYELFTGRRAFEAASLAELSRRQLETTPATPSSLVGPLDPAIENVILWTLRPEPAERPASALEVARALPGGDLLAAALAAGETPSPEAVAAAGPAVGLRPVVAGACLAAVLGLWVLGSYPARSLNPHDHLPFTKSYQALKENARDIAVRLGYVEPAVGSWAGYGYDFAEYLHLVREHGPGSLAEYLRLPAQPVLWMDYRQDDGPLTPATLSGRVSWTNPAPTAADVALEVDLRGRLSVLRVTPSWRTDDEASGAPDWALLFELAGLDIDRFEPVAPTIRPPSFADTRQAWRGVLPDYGDSPVRVEAAALAGRPVFFHKIIPSDPLWDLDVAPLPRTTQSLFTASAFVFILLAAGVLAGALFFAVRNLRRDRGDRRGASRVAAFVFALRMLHWIFSGDHVGGLNAITPLAIAICTATTLAFLTWVVYMACEPYLRRLWPEALVSWTRLLAGRLRDPLVGRDVLLGFAVTSLHGVVVTLAWWLAARADVVGLIPLRNALVILRGGRWAVGEIFSTLLTSTAFALSIMLVLLLLRMILRRTWIAGLTLGVLWGAITALQFAGLFGPRAALFGLLFQAFNTAVIVVLLVRVSLLAAVAASVLGGLGQHAVFTLDSSSPLFGSGLLVTAVAFAIAVYGWHTSLGGKQVVADPLG